MSTLDNGVVIDETTWNSQNFTPAQSVPAVYGQARNITGITVHWWGSYGQRFNDVANYLSRPGGNTSAHFVVEAGRVACLIDPRNAAWHAGSATGNATTIGIECRPEMTPGDLETLAYLIAWLEDVYGPMKIYGHRDWSSTACPGTYYDKLGWVIDRVNRIHAGAKTPAKPAPKRSVKPVDQSAPKQVAPYWVVEKGDTLSKIARYYYGESSQGTLDRLVKRNKLPNANSLKVGQKVYIPGPLVWTVDPGDTWQKIADYYGYDVAYLKSLNPGKEVKRGTVLTIYNG